MDDGSSSLAFDQPSHLSLLQRILRFHSGMVGTGILLMGAGMFLVWLAQHWGVGPRRGRRRRKSAKLPISAMDDDDEEEGARYGWGSTSCVAAVMARPVRVAVRVGACRLSMFRM